MFPIKLFRLSVLLAILFDYVFIGVKCNEPKGTNEDPKNKQNEYLDTKALVEDAIDWAQNISLVWLPKQHMGRSDVTEIVPFTLFPSPFPRKMFEFGQKVQIAYNLLYFRVSNDYEFITKAYEKVAETNIAIRRLLTILKAVTAEGIKQTKSLVLARSDYMCHVATEHAEMDQQKYELKQIEFNAGPIGGLSVSRRITNLHRRTMWKASRKWTQKQMPNSEGDTAIAKALYHAWQAFGDSAGIILIIANKRNLNRIGQKHIEYEINKLSGGKVKSKRIGEPERALLVKKGSLTLHPEDFSLLLEGKRVSVVYQMTDPQEDEQNADEAAAQLLIERSTAIKAPTVSLNLASMKRVQMLLAKPGMLEKFLPEPEYEEMVAELRSTFAGLWDLEDNDEDTIRAIEDAIENPQNYVLKPNMEGGGHNFWGDKIREKLRTFTANEKAAHILMKRVQPLVIKNFMVRSQQTKTQYGPMTSELSIVGWLLGDANGNRVLDNVQSGHFMRTKLEKVDEGGISVGTGAFDSPFLI
ncbi:hypothetical protein niasHT_018956 [Heterodera trifolii]|uniref:Glutathione synthetase n=1 Tax=Heterodera trifolii TaxID=157864 RepID=A0ABD2LDR1_9BILA